MKTIYLIAFLFLFIFKATTGLCTHHTISSSGFTFSPDSISANVGDTIVFNLANIHDAKEVSEATWNIPGNTSNGGFTVAFGGGSTVVTMAKTYYYVCDAHYTMNMKGKIVVTNTIAGVNMLTISHPDFEVFPNPVSASATIKTGLPAGKENQIRIFDVAGKCIYQKNNISPVQYLDLTDMSSGVYMVALKYDDVYLEKKLIVSK